MYLKWIVFEGVGWIWVAQDVCSEEGNDPASFVQYEG